MEHVNIVKKCHDCKKDIEFNGKEIKNGVLLAYNDNKNKINVFKCHDCYGKNPGLRNFRECEVYSRVVGYLRPIKQWNRGKAEEFKCREEYVEQKSLDSEFKSKIMPVLKVKNPD